MFLYPDSKACAEKYGEGPDTDCEEEEMQEVFEWSVRSVEHDGCKLCKYENCGMESKECIGCKQNSIDKYKRMTKADRIRSMSDEELALFLCNIHEPDEDTIVIDDKEFFAETEILEWLQSEVEEIK